MIVPHLAEHRVFVDTQNMKSNISIDRISQKLNNLIHNYDSTNPI
ncbi:hypothetical protein BAZSYMA_ACONTIG00031_2 [Bathymodiolus azoricus thioautotrophic gill symbiont]|uniref:Uncharacterized protein n=1 Tax=Bathymodiolus azoricus thioautotrophic gill symbiont TaxID=235205 RepID=A0A1H6KJY8_9GAMM|nr:hypothetical protein BAZSYMA_ACONTIG00031_2 [Bathymodiolus azoricus thioautotrophic gill symbiont]